MKSSRQARDASATTPPVRARSSACRRREAGRLTARANRRCNAVCPWPWRFLRPSSAPARAEAAAGPCGGARAHRPRAAAPRSLSRSTSMWRGDRGRSGSRRCGRQLRRAGAATRQRSPDGVMAIGRPAPREIGSRMASGKTGRVRRWSVAQALAWRSGARNRPAARARDPVLESLFRVSGANLEVSRVYAASSPSSLRAYLGAARDARHPMGRSERTMSSAPHVEQSTPRRAAPTLRSGTSTKRGGISSESWGRRAGNPRAAHLGMHDSAWSGEDTMDRR